MVLLGLGTANAAPTDDAADVTTVDAGSGSGSGLDWLWGDSAGAPTAPADDSSPTDSLGLLDSAGTNLTDANNVLGQLDVSSQLPGAFVLVSTGFNDSALQLLGPLESAESTILSNDGPLSDLISPLLTDFDQQFYQASEAVLNADQALETAVANGSGVSAAEAGANITEHELFVDGLFGAVPVIVAGDFF
jgi:hypothetical protein